jgi:DNA-binding transcriptional ArsR family regulator
MATIDAPARSATVTHTAALSRLGHALSDPTRTGILLALREAPAYPSDLADALGVGVYTQITSPASN